MVVPFARAWVLRWFRYARTWPKLAARHGLVVHEHPTSPVTSADTPRRGSSTSPQLVAVRCTPATDQLVIRIPPGLDETAFEHATLALAHATKSLGARIRPERSGRVVVELHRRDLLTATIPALPARKHVDLTAVPVGRREDGTVWELPLTGPHILVAGRDRGR